jgi:hypothetical protein
MLLFKKKLEVKLKIGTWRGLPVECFRTPDVVAFVIIPIFA